MDVTRYDKPFYKKSNQELEQMIQELRELYKQTADVSKRRIIEGRAKLLKWALEKRPDTNKQGQLI